MPNDDYIKRSDARAYVRHAHGKGLNLMECIDAIPAADVEPVRHGRTIEDKYLSYEIYVCSVCDAFYPKEMEYFSKQQFKYCPNCGAKMDKEEGSES